MKPFPSVLWIRIRMFLGLPDPEQLVGGTNPDLPFYNKGVEGTEIMLAK
jgi:hypothetical protein